MIIKKILFIIFVNSFIFLVLPISVNAHTTNLGIDGYDDITYDDCDADYYVSPLDIGDGYDEKWYDLIWGNTDESTTPNTFQYTTMCHIDDNIDTIYYQFQEKGHEQPTTTWYTEIGITNGNNVKTKFEQSMLKWNNVYYYKKTADGLYEKHKIINLVNYDSLTDKSGITPHILIHPYYGESDFVAYVTTVNESEVESDTQVFNDIKHKHFTQFRMVVNIGHINNSTILKDRTGAHELGHVLGLFDIDKIENTNEVSMNHHEELLMGYSKNNNSLIKQTNITYKDIAGVAITRGFHTNSDHLWLYDANNPRDGKSKLICSLCNCVKYVEDISQYDYDIYQQCGHSADNKFKRIDSNMIPVASYGNKDYYKCRYCRYVASFSNLVDQNYSLLDNYTDKYHIYYNSVLNYELLENHNFSIHLGGYKYKCDTCECIHVKADDEYTISNYSLTIKDSLEVSNKRLIKVNCKYSKHYEIIFQGDLNFDIVLYDENLNTIQIDYLEFQNNNKHFVKMLNNGTYYIEIINQSSLNNEVNMKIISRNTAYLSTTDNDILINTINFNEDIYSSNYYYFISSKESAIFQFKIIGTKLDGNSIEFPANAVSIYLDEDRTTVLNKIGTSLYNDPACNKAGENSFIAYLSSGSYYYIDINIPTDNLISLNLVIELFDIENLNLFNMVENENTILEIIQTHKSGDYFKMFDLYQSGSFCINVNYDGQLNQDFIFILAKRVYNETTKKYSVQTIKFEHVNSSNDSIFYNLNLRDGQYYIGFINKQDNDNFTVSITRRITQFGSEHLIADPEDINLCGSQIKILEMNESNKSYLENYITVGFTRLIYLDETDFDDLSRLEYLWYSSNESIAKVTNYGTVLGVSQGIVKIMAVHKDDCSIVYVKEFEVIEDNSNNHDEIEVTSNYSIKYSETNNGTFHLQLEKTNCPYPMYQSYSWEQYIYNESIGMDATVLGNCNFHVTGPGNFTIIGTYDVDPRIKIIINVIILDN